MFRISVCLFVVLWIAVMSCGGSMGEEVPEPDVVLAGQ